jgi:ubiquinone/menaquinone biosynthesis C-methylase UbiE
VDDDRARRATSFSAVADAYERARPEYPEEAALWLTGEPPRDVVDLAAGTGKLTRVLVRLGHRVTAVEPLPEMLDLLRRAVPDAQALAGSAEAMPLPGESADAVVVAQAFHWFDQPAALREISRVLRPGGLLGLVWNVRDESVGWVAELSRLIGGEHVGDIDLTGVVDAAGLYRELETEEWRWEQAIDRTRLRELVLSRSYCATRPEAEREAILAAVERLHDEAAGSGSLAMPYVTQGFRAARR